MPLPSETAGAALHARTLLTNGEPLLWAAFGTHVDFDVPGLDEAGRPKANLALRAVDSVVSAAMDTPDNDTRPTADVVVFGRSEDSVAMGYGRQLSGTCLWMLTPARLHIAARQALPQPPAPEPKKGFFAGVAEFGKEIGSVLSSKDSSRRVTVFPLRPIFDVPRAQIATFSLAHRGVLSRRPCLRLSLTDGSGFDLFFDAGKNEAQYERLLALTLGAPE